MRRRRISCCSAIGKLGELSVVEFELVENNLPPMIGEETELSNDQNYSCGNY